MHCIEKKRSWAAWLGLCVLVGCSSRPPAQEPAPAPPKPVAATPVPAAAPAPAPAAVSANLPAPGPVRNWTEVRAQAARRIVAANPGATYLGTVPDILLAIPVLEMELNADGSIKRIDVMRPPGQAPETLQMAIDAVRRAAPFGDVSRLPKPWKFAETFLYRDDRKFKPRTLDQ